MNKRYGADVNNLFSRKIITYTKGLLLSPYVMLCVLLVFIATVYSTNGIWYGDFWEHSAVIKSVLQNPARPSHPFFTSNVPHAFISPYAYIVAGYVHLTSVDIVTGLATFGIINLILFLCGLSYFVRGIDTQAKSNSSFYALLCVLFLWGQEAWGFSGFYYYKLIPSVLPYPSTFCAGLTLIALGIAVRLDVLKSYKVCIAIFVITILVFLSHPLTFLFFASGLGAQYICSGLGGYKRFNLAIIFTVLLAVCLSFLWPFYPVKSLIASGSEAFHQSNAIMYENAIGRTWPIIFCMPLAYWGLSKYARRFIFITVFMMMSIYAYGYFEHKYAFGRTISFAALLLQLAIGIGLSRVEKHIASWLTCIKRLIAPGLIISAYVLSLHILLPAITRSLTIANSIWSGRTISSQQSYKNLTFIQEKVEPGSLVLSDIDTSWKVPTFNGKVIAALHAQAFIEDELKRKADLLAFFETSSSAIQRGELIKKYKPDYLLLDKQSNYNWLLISQEYISSGKGSIVFENNQYKLIKF